MSLLLATQIYQIVYQYTFYSNIFLFTSGLISNLFLILIFVTIQAFRNNQCAFLFIVESIVNIGLFLSIFPEYFVSYIIGQNTTSISLIWCKLQSSISQIFGLSSLFTICFLTFDQFMSTNPRHNWQQISSLKLAHRLAFFNICFVTLHSISFLIVTDIHPLTGCTIYNTALDAYFMFFYYPILSFALPLVLTITFSLLAYRNVRRIVRLRLPVVRRRLDRQLTAMVLARVCCIVLLGLPYIIYSIYRMNLSETENNKLEIAIASLASAIVYSLLYMNFAINFYLFLIISPRFRRQVKHFLVKKCWNLLSGLCRRESSNTSRNQVAPEINHAVTSCVESV